MTSSLATAMRSLRPHQIGGSLRSFDIFVRHFQFKFMMDTEKITLYDSERDILLELNVPVQDALRAKNDINFATALMNGALQEKDSLTGQSARAVTESNETETPTEEEIVNNTDPEEGGYVYRWTSSAVLLLLESYRTREVKFTNGKSSQKKIWEEVAEVLQMKGHNVSGPQCAAKMRSLKKTYKSVKDHNSKSGNDRRTWQFHEVMDSIFAKKAWCSPVALASSSGLCVQPGSTDVTSDSGVALAPSTRPLKANIAALLGKRIRQKEEHEKGREKRHRERMEMDEKLLVILEKLAGNK